MERTRTHKTTQMRRMSGEVIYAALKEDILTLKLYPGQMISENEVAERYHVSRTPVKSAFIRLENEGFIEVVPQKGTFVTLIDYKHIQNVLYMRYVLEVDMLKTILRKPCLQEITKKLMTILKKQEQMIVRGKPNPTSFFEIDSQFHALLFSHVGREQIWSIIQANHVYYTRFRLLDTHVTARYDQLYQEHMEILQALCDRDEARLDKCIYDHLHNLLDHFAKAASGEHRKYLINYES